MEERFDHTAVVAIGFSCLYLADLAQALMGKRASTYLGWDATVDLSYVDNATIGLAQSLCSKELTIGETVLENIVEREPGPHFRPKPKYYSRETGSRTIAELIG